MRDERLNEGFTFSLEQPGERARVRGHRTIKLLMQPLANGGENAVIVPVDICQFGAPSRADGLDHRLRRSSRDADA